MVNSVATDPHNTDSDGTGFTLDTIRPDAPSIDSGRQHQHRRRRCHIRQHPVVSPGAGGTPRLYVSGSPSLTAR